ncbi:MAG: D-glycerate dehydrogenase [Candidatus Thermoplasmatota archaeon]|nr:D-glycerate dehydrogenase [Candidatus Thermoplasmatota archaeon]
MKIFITRKIPKQGLDLLLKQGYKIEINKYNRALTKNEIINGLKNKDGLLCLLTDNIDKDIIESESKLKMIANYAVGYDNIDIEAATEKRIPVSNTPDVLTDTTAEMAWALLLSVSRRIVEGDQYTRSGKFGGWDPMLMLGQDISNKTLGILGTGRIGASFALKSKGFKMNILYFDEKINGKLEKELNAKKVGKSELIKKSDFISIHLPLNKSTFHFIGLKELKNMKNNAILINTSRGAIINEEALAKALKENWIFGAGLDVYENEPVLNSKLLVLNNIIIQPHSASATFKTRSNMAIIAAKNMIEGLNGKIPTNCVNKQIFK